jgi:hypothetical protein
MLVDQFNLSADADWNATDGFRALWPRGGDFMSWDEIRFGATFEDVTPAVVASVPEPTSIAIWSLLEMVGLGAGRRRMRKR